MYSPDAEIEIQDASKVGGELMNEMIFDKDFDEIEWLKRVEYEG